MAISKGHNEDIPAKSGKSRQRASGSKDPLEQAHLEPKCLQTDIHEIDRQNEIVVLLRFEFFDLTDGYLYPFGSSA